MRGQIDGLAAHVHGASRILSVGLGADLITARELALKIEEGARVATTALHLETLLHRHLAACDAGTTALVLFAADARGGERRDWRLRCAAGAAQAIGFPAVAIGAERALSSLPESTLRLVLSAPPAGSELPHALLTGAACLQLLTFALAQLEGSNRDLIRREQRPYRERRPSPRTGPTGESGRRPDPPRRVEGAGVAVEHEVRGRPSWRRATFAACCAPA